MLLGHERVPVTWELANEPNSLRRLVRKGEREARGPVRCCHEAESCGYALRGQLTSAQVSCEMVVPAFTPRIT